MDGIELLWRGRAAARVALDRARFAVVRPQWNRRRFLKAISTNSGPEEVRRAAAAGRWMDAHRGLTEYILHLPPRFVVAPTLRRDLAERIRRIYPDSASEAASRADRLIAGEYDLLGYRGLRFDRVGGIDWHYDPVHNRLPPRHFWTAVPYLNADCGDHKIIWELNRHQHWLSLGRAYWLTGEPRYRRAVIHELESWLADNPPLAGINWASMLELALRAISWIWAVNLFVGDAAEDSSPWLIDLFVGLEQQLAHVEQNLSYYFSPNTHLLGEALGLYVCGMALPMLERSRRWADLGRRVLVREARRQIAGDGGHLERSTHYHRYTLDFYLLALVIARINGDPAATDFEHTIRRVAFAARLLADDRGRLPHIGDDDGGSAWPLTGRRVDDIGDSLAAASVLVERPDLRVGPVPEEALWLLAHPTVAAAAGGTIAGLPAEPLGSAALADTGYYVSRSAAGDHLVFDAGPHGFKNGGHAHADALSMTLTLAGEPFLIDPGTGVYTVDTALRDRFRSTTMHNTVALDQRSASIPRDPFHWQTTADGVVHRWRSNRAFDYIDASHRGYAPLGHRRRLLILHGDLMIVTDWIVGEGIHRADVHWHIDARWHVAASSHKLVFTSPSGQAELAAPGADVEVFGGDEATGLGWNAPVYGQIEPALTVRSTHSAPAPFWMMSVFGLDPSNSIRCVNPIPVWSEAGALDHSLALRITRNRSIDHFAIAETASTATPDASQSARPRWRAGWFETDAHMLFSRTNYGGAVTRVALVDGSMVRTSAGTPLIVDLPQPRTDLHLALMNTEEQRTSSGQVRVSGGASGARVQVGGRDLPIAVDRRRPPRAQGRS